MANDHAVQPILLVEDNPLDVDLTLRAFQRNRLANPVIVARDGEEAVAFIARWEAGERTPLVVLLDINMPRMNGLEVLRAMKSSAVSRSIPVVVLTSSSEGRDVQRAYELGANSYIVKPVNFDKFLDVASQIEVYWCAINQPPG
ncbi:MAG: response regulator [Gammaproteobacteria bacterium]|nr:response regulator [Gammaproteobacteria bacterium]